MSGFKDGGQVIVPVPLEFTGTNTWTHTLLTSFGGKIRVMTPSNVTSLYAFLITSLPLLYGGGGGGLNFTNCSWARGLADYSTHLHIVKPFELI